MADSAVAPDDVARLSLVEALAAIDRGVSPVAPIERDLASAVGCTLAADAVIESGALTVRLTGARLRHVDIALLDGGTTRVSVRVPKFFVVGDGAVGALIAGAIESNGGMAVITDTPLAVALDNPSVDAVVAIGKYTLARDIGKSGRIDFDGVAVNPGGATAFGNAHDRPVLILPAELDGALAGWLTVGRRLLARLAFRLIEEQPFLLELARPVASKRGIAEVVPVRRRAAQVEPLVGDTWTTHSIARADGWLLVPADSEGLPAGAKVQMRPWP